MWRLGQTFCELVGKEEQRASRETHHTRASAGPSQSGSEVRICADCLTVEFISLPVAAMHIVLHCNWILEACPALDLHVYKE